MTRIEAEIWGWSRLKRHRCPDTDPEREATALLGHALKCRREELAIRPTQRLTAAQERRFREFIARRLMHEPLAYILSTAPFLDFQVAVTPDTLIPRPATEILTLAAIAELKRAAAAEREHRLTPLVIDVGTGSGAIALALTQAMPQADVIGTDESAAALAVARKNARSLGLSGRARFLKGDLLSPALKLIADRRNQGRRLMIIANLPYIPSGQWRRLPPDIRRFEPKSALTSGPDGLRHYRRLIRQTAKLLNSGNPDAGLTVVLEILPEQFTPLSYLIASELSGLAPSPVYNDTGLIIGLKTA